MEDLTKAVAKRDFFKLLNTHATRAVYDSSRADVLQLIHRKISYKEHLIKRQDEEFTDQLNKSITSVEFEINTLIGFVKAFDKMAEFMAEETVKTEDEAYRLNRKVLILSQLLDAETERVDAWSNTAFKLSGDYIQRQLNPSQFAQ